MELTHLEDIHHSFFFFFFFLNLAVNKLITDKRQKFFSLIAEHTGFIKYALNQ